MMCVGFYLAEGKPQAGLPFLCSGAVLAYLLAGFIIFGLPPLKATATV